MRGRRSWFFWGTVSLAGSGLVGLISCLSDPRDGDAVTVISTCDESTLSTDPSSPQSTLRAYLDATNSLLAQANSVAADITAGCNAVGAALGLAAGTDPVSACKPLSARALTDITNGVPDIPNWVETHFTPNCQSTAGTKEKCVSSCASGTCDISKCSAAQTNGTCAGTCTGLCVTSGTNEACNGSCAGAAPLAQPATCGGECIGTCSSVAGWSANCAGGCGGGFLGVCTGTCTGTCNNVAINVTPSPDGGADAGADAGDAGHADGGADSGAADGGAPPDDAGGTGNAGNPPSNADGNCTGTCAGVCSSGALGTCNGSACLDYADAGAGAPALAAYDGNCFDLCTGECQSGTGSGTTTTCNGTCTETQAACIGSCQGGCTGTITNGDCTGVLNCGQNTECENACEAQAALAVTCAEPTIVEAYGVSDPAFSQAMVTKGAQLGRAVTQLDSLRNALEFIGNRAYGDFVAIGLSGDLVRACVTQGNTNVATASTAIDSAISANPTVIRQ